MRLWPLLTTPACDLSVETAGRAWRSGRLLQAALDGFGIAYLTVDGLLANLQDGTSVRVLADWCEPLPDITFIIRAATSRRRRWPS